MSLYDIAGGTISLIISFFFIWLLLDLAYCESAWFRRRWALTGWRFPHLIRDTVFPRF